MLKIFICGLIACFSFVQTSAQVARSNKSHLKFNSSTIRTSDSAFAKQLQEIEAALDQNLPKTALELAEKNYKSAKNNDAYSLIFAVIRAQLQAQTQENSEILFFQKLEKEISAANFPKKQILQSILADNFLTYYENSSYRTSQRTAVVGKASNDLRTWSAQNFLDTVLSYYKASISREDELRKISVRDFTPILETSDGSEILRPTLYDLLAHRFFDFLRNDRFRLPKPESEFELTDLGAFAPAQEFANYNFKTTDTTSFNFLALQILQKLTRSHLDDSLPAALVDLEIQRLKFARQITIHEDKDSVYEAALAKLQNSYKSYSCSADALFERANFYFEKKDFKRAYDLCVETEKYGLNVHGAKNATALKSQILVKEVSIQIEKTVQPNSPLLAQLAFRNVSKIWCRLVKREIGDNQQYFSKDELRIMLSKTPAKEWEQELPKTVDFQEHTTRIKIPAVSVGKYLLLVSPKPDFPLDENAIFYESFYSTNFAVNRRAEENGGTKYFVLSAESGETVSDVNVKIIEKNWSRGREKKELIKELKTDKTGSFSIPSTKLGEILIELRQKDDFFELQGGGGNYNPNFDHNHERTLFFTDRSLYRPGQTIYFKGIIINENQEIPESAAVVRKKTKVVFRDVNRQQVGELQLETNEFGSFNGTFIAPSNLTGEMSIGNESNGISFSVEEYKRPKFEVKFEPIKGNYKLGNEVKITGKAVSYSGSNVDNATVKFRVVRSLNRNRWYFNNDNSGKEITHGTVKTNAEGEFEVHFMAKPDKSVQHETNPYFTFEISADVTDINGETHSANTNVLSGYTSLQANISMKQDFDKSEKTNLIIHSTNLSNEPVKAVGTVIIEKLKLPARIFRVRSGNFNPRYNHPLFDKDKLFTMTKSEFYENFPHDAYDDEDLPENWEAEKSVLNQNITTDETGEQNTAILGYETGIYRATVRVRNQEGDSAVLSQIFTVFDKAGNRLSNAKTPFFSRLLTNSCQPGDTASFLVGTGYENAKILYEIERRGKILTSEWLTLSQSQRLFSIPILEKYRGGITAHLTLVRDYRIYLDNINISVPWTNKELTLKKASFRDKITPGAKEEWRLTISGSKGEKVVSELLAGMYDASLDALKMHSWDWYIFPTFPARFSISQLTFGITLSSQYQDRWNEYKNMDYQEYDRLKMNHFIFEMTHTFSDSEISYGRGAGEGVKMMASPPPIMAKMNAKAENESDNILGNSNEIAVTISTEGNRNKPPEIDLSSVKMRKNFNETAFFFPDLRTNEQGDVVLKFTAPEALTRWKFLAFAHTPDMKNGLLESSTITQKDLMVMPNMPRFLREGDTITLSAKINSMTDKKLDGTAQLLLFDGSTMNPVSLFLPETVLSQKISVSSGASVSVSWRIFVQEGLNSLAYRVVAQAGDVSDGEAAVLPVLPNKMLVTESMPMAIRGNQTKNFTFDKLTKSGKSKTMRNHKLTLEMSSNPAWYAIQSLPLLMEFPHECSEQTFSRFYANSLAAHIANSKPKIKAVFDQWKNTDALLSNLEKNQDLKSVLLQETPWVLEGKTESENKKRVGLLFDLNTMSHGLEMALDKLKKLQDGTGGWGWFPGDEPSRFITQYIVQGFGHLQTLGVLKASDAQIEQMLNHAVEFMDATMTRDYNKMKEWEHFNPKDNHFGHYEAQYLYARSFFREIPVSAESKEAFNFWKEQSQKFWTKTGLLTQGMTALALQRFDDITTPKAIIKSLRERSLRSDEMGMYWKQTGGWFWQEAPIETQAMLIEAFDDIAHDSESVEEMKIWLLKQKQTTNWKTTIATSEACYALLRRGMDVLESDQLVGISLGGQKIDPRTMPGTSVEAGTGYFRTSWNGGEIKPEMGNITLTKTDKGIAWGSLYWQYFERLDKITPAKTPLSIDKKLFLQVNSGAGNKLVPIADTVLHVGDVVKVRVEIRTDRDMEYIHLKDMRGAGFEPMIALSEHKWQDGLGYYESLRDASTNFFISWLPKGVYVFEYPLRVTHEGVFLGGITTIQSMYAPEFSSHSEGIEVRVK